MIYKKIEIKYKWLILLLITVGVIAIFIFLTPSKDRREGVSTRDIVSGKETIRKSDTEFEIDEKTEDIKIQSAFPQEKKDISEPSSVDVSDKVFAVQVFSFQDENRAKAASEKLKKEGYPAYVITQDLEEKGTWYRVRVGGFNSEKEAIELLENLKKGYKGGFVVRRRKDD